MIRKKVVKPVRNFFKEKFRNLNREIYAELEKNKPIQVTIFYPYLSGSESYIIKSSKDDHELCEQGLPIPGQDLWLGYGANIKEHMHSGKSQVEMMKSIVSEGGADFVSFKRILELGCGAGRLIRWLKPISEKAEIWGTDISSEHIYWANKYLNPPFNFATTTTIPHLPFEDRYFDFIYAGSVFTHIDDLSDSWLLELRRIVNDNGYVYLTIHDKHTLKLLNEVPVWRESMLSSYLNENDLFNSNKESFDMFVGMRGPDSQVFYDIDYFCKTVRSIFEVISVTQEAYGYQTAVLMRRK